MSGCQVSWSSDTFGRFGGFIGRAGFGCGEETMAVGAVTPGGVTC